jgi:hypothetical protein
MSLLIKDSKNKFLYKVTHDASTIQIQWIDQISGQGTARRK